MLGQNLEDLDVVRGARSFSNTTPSSDALDFSVTAAAAGLQ